MRIFDYHKPIFQRGLQEEGLIEYHIKIYNLETISARFKDSYKKEIKTSSESKPENKDSKNNDSDSDPDSDDSDSDDSDDDEFIDHVVKFLKTRFNKNFVYPEIKSENNENSTSNKPLIKPIIKVCNIDYNDYSDDKYIWIHVEKHDDDDKDLIEEIMKQLRAQYRNEWSIHLTIPTLRRMIYEKFNKDKLFLLTSVCEHQKLYGYESAIQACHFYNEFDTNF